MPMQFVGWDTRDGYRLFLCENTDCPFDTYAPMQPFNPRPINEAVCDFCMSHAVKWCFFTHPFILPIWTEHENRAHQIRVELTTWTSDQEWACCSECHDLIVEDRVEDLAARSMAGIAALEGRPYDSVRKGATELYQAAFFRLRNGDPQPEPEYSESIGRA